MARHQCRKRLFGIPVGILPQQIHVCRILHLPINVRCRQKVTIYFDLRRCRTTAAIAARTGSSAVRGNGLFAGNDMLFQNQSPLHWYSYPAGGSNAAVGEYFVSQ
jgi:hypothetical protein